MNNCSFIGNAGKNAVLRHTAGGDAVLGWSLAVSAGYGEKKVTTWVDCSLWGKRAESLADKIAKGDRIGVTGELSTREHEGKTYVTLRVADVTLLGNKSSRDEPQRGGGPVQQRGEAPKPARGTPAQAESFEDEEIPFITNRGKW